MIIAICRSIIIGFSRSYNIIVEMNACLTESVNFIGMWRNIMSEGNSVGTMHILCGEHVLNFCYILYHFALVRQVFKSCTCVDGFRLIRVIHDYKLASLDQFVLNDARLYDPILTECLILDKNLMNYVSIWAEQGMKAEDWD
jgi:hypothetical protein